MRNKINIIILTYNCLDKIKQCLNNLYKNTDLSDFKLFILDNGSEEDTVQYLKEIKNQHDNIYINFRKENMGIIKGRNKCFDFSRENSDSQYIIFLDSDQYVQENWLDSYLEMIEKENFDLIGCEAWKLNQNYYPYKKVTDPKETYSYVGGGGMMMRSNIFEKLGKFDEDYDFIYFEDPSLCFSAHKEGYKIGWNSEPIIVHNHSGPLLSKKNRQYFMKNWKTFQKKWKK